MIELLNIYCDFVHHRQQTLIEKIKKPSYVSPILGYNKFTNVQRIFDRVSQYELREVIYKGDQTPIEVLKRLFLFNQFKTVYFWHCWQCYIDKWGDNEGNFYSSEFNSPHFGTYVSTEHSSGRLFTNAYVVPGKTGQSKVETIHQRCLVLNNKINSLQGCIDRKSIMGIFSTLQEIPGIGIFLASQICFDFLWHNSCSEWLYLPALGVGAVRGAKKLKLINENHHDPLSALSRRSAERKALLLAFDNIKQSEFPYVTANNKPVPLQIADIQNTFCEFDKYMRLIQPEVKTSNNAPTRIKNRYKPGEQIDYIVPGHWVSSSEKLVPIDRRWYL
ncbi:hypothetical protein JYQ62_16040 [Nostoc sp. UHCC 0702]|nr:hypothetical protein JYQ62_16040 [Nostoc sp. UHCC 0702]